jgi:predicted flap endonuclease-1-like 5' DNA nuclease
MNTERFFEGPGGSNMSTYVWEIALILLGAFILGYLLRYLLNSKFKSQIEDLQHENSILKSKSSPAEVEPSDVSVFEGTIKEQKDKIEDLNQRLSECYASRIKTENALSTLKAKVDETTTQSFAQVAETAVPVVASGSVGGKKDDLKKIEGVGPKIEELLNHDGIYTFEQLVASSVERIKGILTAAGPNYAVHNPTTWGEQAELANNGNWEALDTLQEELKGGKRK